MMADSVEEAYARYGTLSFMKAPIQYSYILTLAIVVLLALLLAIYGSIEFAERLVKPIEALEKQTGAAKNKIRLPEAKDEADEITTLVQSFMQAQKEAAWSDVAKRMAHEINNPLTPIQLSAERIKKRYSSVFKGEDLDFITHSTETIVNQVEVLRGMVNAFGKFAEEPALTIESFNIISVIKESVSLYSKKDNKKTFKLSFHSESFIVQADEQKLRQVFNNLIKNALDATANSTAPIINIKTSNLKINNKAYIELTISDNGQGFEPDIVGNAFEPYVTTKTKGKGLGLAIVKHIIEEHKGHIELKNKKAQGASVIITLPVLQPRKDRPNE
jgi:nitrogen fixation/metabolism regulation signal transduction histidine kinase